MASGDLPEMMLYLDTRSERWAQLVKADKLADLTDIWAKTASPTNKRWKGYPGSDFFKSVTVNGRILGVPFNQGDGTAANLLWLRKDWLDQVGLKPPTTLDELYAVGRAFMQKGLAKMGLAAAGKNGLVGWHATLDPIAGAYGIIPTFWLKDAGGNLVYGSVQPAMADVLALLRKWYADGFLEPDFPAKAEGDVTKVIASGQVGMYFGYWWEPQYGIDANQKNDPKAQWIFTDVPMGPTGRRGRANGQVPGSACAFLKGIPQIKIEAMFEATNWLMERMEHSLENCDYILTALSPAAWSTSFEGYDHVWEGNEIKKGQFRPDWYFYGSYMPMCICPYLATGDKDHPGIWGRLKQVMSKDPKTWNPYERYYATDPQHLAQVDAANRVYETKAEMGIENEYWGPATKTMVEAKARLDKMELETLMTIITGQAPLSRFDQFVKDWKEQGGDKITEEVNAWYKSLK
jgi:putative aldouronate transport system substrate-binding protein